MYKYITIIFLCFTISGHAQNETGKTKPYHEVITPEAITEKGFLQTHLLGNRLYLEIPHAMLNKAMLFVEHDRYSSPQQMMWVKKDGTIHLVLQEIESKAGNTIPLVEGRTKVKITPATFPILAKSKNGSSYVIDVTALFLNTPKPLSGLSTVIFNNLAFIDRVLVFDDLIEVKTNKTITSDHGPLAVDNDFSLLLLPEPMAVRLYDHRMGFFNEKGELSTTMMRACIMRWRLEKKDRDQALSEPIKPIMFYFDPATPDKWKPYLKAGVYEWLPAFEAAGFKNAIEVKEPPVHDKNWSVNSMKYSNIRWNDRTNYRGREGGDSAGGSIIVDQRTGEILKGDIKIGAPYEYLSDEYFVRCSPLDPRAQEYPFPDDLMGELIQRVAAHEAGHVFGLRDGDYGEYAYPFEKMRDEKWLREMGHTPSVMNYTRDNYIVQPEDHIPPSLLHQKVGPADHHSIRWGYTPFQNIDNPDDELPYLEKIVRERDTVPWYHYGGAKLSTMIGPGSTDEVVDCDDPVKATRLGLENLKRVIELIPKATRNERGNGTLERLYGKTLNLWVDQMESVASLVGGYTVLKKEGNQEGLVYDYSSIPVERQKEAVEFLTKEAFHAPLWMVSPEITRRYETNGTLGNISSRQIKVLTGLLSSTRLKNLEEIGLTTESSYGISDLFKDLHRGLWHELEDRTIKINPYRQETQLAYITILKRLIEGEYNNKYRYSNDIRGSAFDALNHIKNSIENRIQKINDTPTWTHLELCLLEINKIKKLDQ